MNLNHYTSKVIFPLIGLLFSVSIHSQENQQQNSCNFPENCYVNRHLSLTELEATLTAVNEFKKHINKEEESRFLHYFYKNGEWLLSITINGGFNFINQDTQKETCVLVGSSSTENGGLWGGAMLYCIDNKTGKIIRTEEQR